MPQIVLGIALLNYFSLLGLIDSRVGLMLGHLVVTLPLRIFNYTEYNFDPTINAVSTIFVVLALVLIIVLDRLIGLVRIG